MALNWTYNPNEYTEVDYKPIPAGDHRVRIEEIAEKTFKSGSQGFEITLAVSGYNAKLWYYLVLDPSDTKKTNQRIGTFFDSFGITNPNLALYVGWLGKVGAVRVKHEEYNGEQQAKVAFCLGKKAQEKLPAWQETGDGSAAPATTGVDISSNDLPF